MNEFLLSDESLNSHGFKVLTKGINLSNFERNPVMYYNHNREQGVIGKWTKLRVSGNKLFGTPVFDEKDPIGAKIADKVKDGFIKAVSIGAGDFVFNEINGEKVVVSCNLLECSVCDIPSNKNALMLYVDDKQVTNKDDILKLFANQGFMTMDLKSITDVLELSANTSIADIVTAIRKLKETNAPEHLIDDALKMNLIAKYERDELLELASASPEAFRKYIDKRKEKVIQAREEEGLVLTNQAFREGRFDCDPAGIVRAFWLKNFVTDFEGTKEALESIPERRSFSEFIHNTSTSSESRAGWTLANYRKKAPMELKNDPALYQQLLDQEQYNNISSESRAGWTLTDYRKKAPMELKNNPALYQQLLDQE